MRKARDLSIPDSLRTLEMPSIVIVIVCLIVGAVFGIFGAVISVVIEVLIVEVNVSSLL